MVIMRICHVAARLMPLNERLEFCTAKSTQLLKKMSAESAVLMQRYYLRDCCGFIFEMCIAKSNKYSYLVYISSIVKFVCASILYNYSESIYYVINLLVHIF